MAPMAVTMSQMSGLMENSPLSDSDYDDVEEGEILTPFRSLPHSQCYDQPKTNHKSALGELYPLPHANGFRGRTSWFVCSHTHSTTLLIPRQTCTLNILVHLHRSVFSQSQLELFLWLLHTNGVQDTPSITSMLALNKGLQSIYGIETIKYKGEFGRTYYANALAQILVQVCCADNLCNGMSNPHVLQDLANPKIRPHFHFYPHARGQNASGPWEADRWLREVDAQMLTPMARIRNQDYCIHEPARLRYGHVCMPTRWFLRDNPMYVGAWRLAPNVANETSGWVVYSFEEFDVRDDEFLLSFPAFVVNYRDYQ